MTLLRHWSERLEGEPPRVWYHVLLLALVGLFVLDPLGGTLKVAHWLLTLGSTTVLVLSILVVGRTLVQVGIALGLLLPAVVLSHLFADPATPGGVAGLLSSGLLLWYVSGSLAGRIFRHQSVTWESISGAICVYLLMGLAWSTTYRICEGQLADPSAFEGVVYGTGAGEQDSVRQQLTYYSFVTLTTLGYGDISPTHPITRMLATLEAVVGQLFLVVMVARLVALQVAGHASRESSP
ncbi:MAG: ion channel [Planctomycetota bacterium]